MSSWRWHGKEMNECTNTNIIIAALTPWSFECIIWVFNRTEDPDKVEKKRIAFVKNLKTNY